MKTKTINACHCVRLYGRSTRPQRCVYCRTRAAAEQIAGDLLATGRYLYAAIVPARAVA